MKYVYAAILTPEDGKILVNIPDLPGVFTFGDNLADALLMAKDAAEMWLWDAENKNEVIPPASNQNEVSEKCETFDEFVSLIVADTDEYRKQMDTRSVKKTSPNIAARIN
jgi:predicted RNase H-like HicB family nuclease